VLEQRAASAESLGNPRAAADIYVQLANSVTGARRIDFLLEAARLYITAGATANAAQLLASIGGSASAAQRALADTLLARIDLAEGRPAEAAARVAPLLAAQDSTLRLAALEIQGLAFFALGRPADAVRSLSEREVWLDDIESIRANQRTIWTELQRMRAPVGAAVPTGEPLIDGWLALAPIALLQDADMQRRELLEWRTANRQHPAAGILLRELLIDENAGDSPRQIALLLPLMRDEALAIRDGFIAAYIAAGVSDRTALRVYDTAREGAVAAYLRAQVDGADFIVGPLLRQEVEDVVAQSGLIPTLALNYTLSEPTGFGNVYQFALAPEDEAAAAARRAVAEGQMRAVALIQSTDRGYRIYNSFRAEYERLGGSVIAMMGYDEAVQNYAARITSLMNIDRSQQRQRRLEANLGVDIAFEPRRRQDIDAIFLAANAVDGRLLAPQLEYFYAGDVPTYGISEIYDARPNARNGDLDRIVFPDMPWLIAPTPETETLRREIAANWPQRSAAAPRFYGMGVDAFAIVEMLYRDPFFTSLEGVSGTLSMDVNGRIHRDLPFAQFRNGRPELLPPAPEPATPFDNVVPVDRSQPLFDLRDAPIAIMRDP